MVGYVAGAFNDSGFGNTYLGAMAGNQNVDGGYNTFLGNQAGRFATSGNSNTFLGGLSGWQTIDGQYNTFVGTGSGYENRSGSANTYLGNSAGQNNTEGDGNVFIGSYAGSNETGSNKLYISNSFSDPPLLYGDFSTRRVGIGTKALEAELDVAGACNVSTKYSIAGSTVVAVPGELNTHVGTWAGAGNTSSSGTFVGSYAGNVNQGPDNTFLGAQAGAQNTAGEANTFVGAYAGIDHVSGDGNTYVGTRAGENNQTGDGNTFLGSSAGLFTTTGSGNTLVGYNAGLLAGSGNVLIGNQACATVPVSNKLYIANGVLDDAVLIHGDFSTGQLSFGCVNNEYTFEFASTSTKAFKVGNSDAWIDMKTHDNPVLGFSDNNGNEAGIIYGTENGSGENVLSIWGVNDAGGGTSGTNFHENGYVGIGTNDPERKLHIVGVNPRVLIEATSSNPEVDFKSNGDASGEVWAVYKDSATDDLRFYQNGDRLTIEGGTGNVGIGTESPGSCKLYVNGGAGGTGAWNSCSDQRFKRNVRAIGDALGKVLDLRGVTFDWKADEYPDKNFERGAHYGCIAQEVQEILPEVVREGPDGDKAVAYSEIVPVLIESIKDQQAQIEELRTEVCRLKEALDSRD
jgi:hypothetical protein